MTEYTTCPVCKKPLPEKLEANFCPFCGVRFGDALKPEEPPPREYLPEHLQAQMPPPEPDEAAPEEDEEEAEGIPWESEGEASFFQRLSRTWSESLFNPAAFFARVPRVRSIGQAFLYALIFQMIGTLFSIYWQRGSLSELERNIDEAPAAMQEFFRAFLDSAAVATPSMQLLFAPVAIIFWLFLATLIFHVGLLIIGSASRGFETTFRVVAYSQGVQIFHAIPFAGSMIVFVYSIVLWVIGFREAHKTTTGRAAFGVFAPLVFLCCAVAFLAIVFVSMLMRTEM